MAPNKNQISKKNLGKVKSLSPSRRSATDSEGDLLAKD